MKNLKLILTIVILLFITTTQTSAWTKYFNKQAKKIRKSWKSNKSIFKNSKYDTSYARALVFVNSKGEITDYKIKSYCVPYQDTQFISIVESTLSNIKRIDPLPLEYKVGAAAFTIKFHTNLPKKINSNNIDWDKYGLVDIEIDRKNVEIIFD